MTVHKEQPLSSPEFEGVPMYAVDPLYTRIGQSCVRQLQKQTAGLKGYLSSGTGSKYLLRADLMELKQPLFGLNFSVTSTVDYTLQNQNTKEMKYTRKVTATGSASFSDAALAVERLRIANERSIQKNLEVLLEDLRQQK